MKISKVWLLSLIVVFAFAFTPALAQESLPEGGSGFDDATKLEPASYIDGEMGDDSTSYYLLEDIKPGQKAYLEATIENADNLEYFSYDLVILNQDRTELLSRGHQSGEQKIKVHWMPGTNQESSDYYLKIKTEDVWGEGDTENVKFFLDYEKEYYFDAGSGQDAGDDFGQALSADVGNYSGYLLSSSIEEADRTDTYKLNVKKGKKLVAEVTPPSDGAVIVAFYNDKRQMVGSEEGSNLGAITEASLSPQESGTYYVKIRIGGVEEGSLIEYDVSFSKKEAEEQASPTTGTTDTQESIEDIKDQIPEDLEGKSLEEIKEIMKQRLPKNVYQNFFTEEGFNEKGIIQSLMGVFFNFLKKVLLWGLGLIIAIAVIIYIFKKMVSSDSEEEDKETEPPKVKEEKNKDKGPNKSDN